MKFESVAIAIVLIVALLLLSQTENKVHRLECSAGLKSYAPLGYEWPCPSHIVKEEGQWHGCD